MYNETEDQGDHFQIKICSVTGHHHPFIYGKMEIAKPWSCCLKELSVSESASLAGCVVARALSLPVAMERGDGDQELPWDWEAHSG